MLIGKQNEYQISSSFTEWYLTIFDLTDIDYNRLQLISFLSFGKFGYITGELLVGDYIYYEMKESVKYLQKLFKSLNQPVFPNSCY